MKTTFLILASLLFSVSIFAQTHWSLNGNAGTDPSNHFFGTIDNTPLILKVNNKWAGFTGYSDKNNVSFGYLSLTNAQGNGTANTALGAQSLQWNSAASGNVAVGTWALEWCTQGDNNVAVGVGALGNSLTVGNHNVAIGQKALFNNKQSENTAVGSEALFTNTEGVGLTAMGFRALCNNTTGEFNTAFGYNALLLNTTGFWNVALGSGSLQNNRTGRFNTAGGNSSLHFNETGIENTAFGEQALGGNLDGSYNTAVGVRSLWSVLYTPGVGDSGYGHGGANTALGYEALKGITSGEWNVGVGVKVMQSNTSGHNNIAVGGLSLMSNTIGNYNIAIGSQALNNNVTGDDNIAIGYLALKDNSTGNKNIAIGGEAGVSNEDLTNTIAIGYGAVATTSNQIVLGNNKITSIWAHTNWTVTSDGRIKKNVKQDVPGLTFINKLRPVTYDLDLDAINNFQRSSGYQGDEDDLSEAIDSIETMEFQAAAQQERRHTGFIAQEVEEAAKDIGYDFNGVDVNEGDDGLYGLKYSKFIVPLVKAVQELSDRLDAKEEMIELLYEQIRDLEEINAKTLLVLQEHMDHWEEHQEISDMIQMQIDELNRTADRLEALHNNTSHNSPALDPTPDAFLEQNYPNPFSQSTTIKYTLPQRFHSAKIIVTDISGRTIRQVPISGSGAGSVTIEAGSLFEGMYLYYLYIDNTLVDTKKMVLTK